MPRRDDPADDAFLWDQGPASGLSAIRFHDPGPVFAAWPQPNVALFREQVEVFKDAAGAGHARPRPRPRTSTSCWRWASSSRWWSTPSSSSRTPALRAAEGIDGDTVDQVFDVLVRDFSRHAVDLHGKAASTPAQMELALQMIRKPAQDPARRERIWGRVHALKDAYEMSP